MAQQFTTLPEHDFSRGIDARSGENQIQQGFVADALNVDFMGTSAKKRKGFQQQSGFVPIRVKSITYLEDLDENNIQLDLDANIDLATLGTTPIIVHGRTSSQNAENVGVFPNNSDVTRYYPSFSTQIRHHFEGTDTLSLESGASGAASSNLFVGVTRSLSTSNLSHQVVYPELVSINQSTFNIDIDYTTPTPYDGFVYLSDKQAVAGTTYVSSPETVDAMSTETITIAEGEHNLDNFRFLIKCFIDTGSTYDEFTPDSIVVDPNTGSIDIEVTNSTMSNISVIAIITCVPQINVRTASAAAGATTTMQIENFDEVFPFISVYSEDLITGDLTEITPNEIIYDTNTEIVSIECINDSPDSVNFVMYWDYGRVLVNRLTVTDTLIADDPYIDSEPQLTIWGIDHRGLYLDDENREGWVNHIDTYSRESEERQIVGLGGNLFTERSIEESGITHLMPSNFANLTTRLETDHIISPVFHAPDIDPGRTAGWIEGSNVESNFVPVTDVEYLGNSTVRYVLNLGSSAEAYTEDGSPTSVGNVITALDQLTVQGMEWAIHNGTFEILAASWIDEGVLAIDVLNSQIDSSDFDIQDGLGQAAIFTDSIAVQAGHGFTTGDIIHCSLFPEHQLVTVLRSADELIVVGLVVDTFEIPEGQRLSATRTSPIVPLRNVTGDADVDWYVWGDSIVFGEYSRKFNINSVRVEDDIAITLQGDGNNVTISATDAFAELRTGQKVQIIYAGQFDGIHQITKLDNSTLEISSSISGVGSGLLLGMCIELNESVQWTDGDNCYVNSRWIPIEIPTDTFELTPKTRTTHFGSNSYVTQPFLRSTTINNSMYFTNSQDEVMKFDGENVYRAGLFKWQPGAFVTKNDTGATLVVGTPSAATSAKSSNQLTVTSGHQARFVIGDLVEYDDTSTTSTYTIVDLSDGLVTLDRVIEQAAGTGTLSKVYVYRYYFRLNAVDSNGNIVASAVTGLEDFRVEVASDVAIEISLIGMPAWDVYNYSRLEVEIYRTLANTEAPFYRITSIPLSFNLAEGYLRYIDTTNDQELGDIGDTDPLELVATFDRRIHWNEPLRAKHICSSNNRLMLANLVDYPELDISLVDSAGTKTIEDLNGLRWDFRRDDTSTGAVAVTDNINTQRYEWLNVDDITPLAIEDITQDGSETEIEITSHTLEVGNWIYIYHAAKDIDQTVNYCGWHQIVAVDTDLIYINYSPTDGDDTFTVDSVAVATDAMDIPVLLGLDGNRNTRSDRISGELQPIPEAMYRLSQAINAVNRVCAEDGFQPWLLAYAGGEYSPGQLIVRKPRVDEYTPEVTLTGATDFRLFISGILRTLDGEASMSERVFPSRVILSYANFPDGFENPSTTNENFSSGIKDINVADGQVLTGLSPLFSESITSASQRENIVLAFKENSVHAFNSNSTEPAQQIKTERKGCSFPLSIANTRHGVAFAHNSGIYEITHDLQFKFIGKYAHRLWTDLAIRGDADLVHGSNFSLGGCYRLSVPTDIDVLHAEDVFQYNYENFATEEDRMFGGWSRYDRIPALGWSNSANNCHYASSDGRIFSGRIAGDNSDFRDDINPINFTLKTRALDFGDARNRKLLLSITSHFRAIVTTASNVLRVAIDLFNDFRTTDGFRVTKQEESDGLSNKYGQVVSSLRSSIDRSKFNYIQLEYSNAAIDEPCELLGADFGVSLLSGKGTAEAKDSQ